MAVCRDWIKNQKRKGEKYMFRRDVQNLADVLNLCLRRNGLETPLLQHRLVNAEKELNELANSPEYVRISCDGETAFEDEHTLFLKPC